MAKPQKWTEELIKLSVEGGRGQGDDAGCEHGPQIQEFSSSGTRTYTSCLTLNRTAHTLSGQKAGFPSSLRPMEFPLEQACQPVGDECSLRLTAPLAMNTCTETPIGHRSGLSHEAADLQHRCWQ